MNVIGWTDHKKGVEVKPSKFLRNASVCYNGLLARSGADQVYLHCGYGDNHNWRTSTTIKMDRTDRGWESSVDMRDSILNFCFKDSAGNWDNNNGQNWLCRSDFDKQL